MQLEMKHSVKITLILLGLYLGSLLIGLHIIGSYIDLGATRTTGEVVFNEEMYLIAPPEMENESISWIPIMFAVLIGTGIILLIARFGQVYLWKLWFFASISLALSLAFAPYVWRLFDALHIGGWAMGTIGLAMIFAALKAFRHHIVVHNVTELFIYGGIAALFVPILNIQSAIVLLVIISLYDAYAVWKSQHMVTLAKFQAQSNAFAGLFIPKSMTKTKGSVISTHSDTSSKESQSDYAILGGGDIAFPLLFAGAVLKTGGVLAPILVVLGATLGLSWLLLFSKPGKFYPAMPIITVGCFIGYLLGVLI